jgi:hypothetical protein
MVTERTRVVVAVEVDLDPVPGMFHAPEDWARYLRQHMSSVAPHYHPAVEVIAVDRQGGAS